MQVWHNKGSSLLNDHNNYASRRGPNFATLHRDICTKQTTTQMISASSKIQHGRYLPQAKYNTGDICLKQNTTQTISASSKNNTDDICLKQPTTQTISASSKLQNRRYLPQTNYNTDDICLKQTTTKTISASGKLQHTGYLVKS